MNQEKRHYELRVVEETAELAGDFPAGILSVLDDDPPDIQLEGDRRIAIEVTRYFAGPRQAKSTKPDAPTGSLIQAVQAQQDRIVRAAHELYSQHSSRSLVVHVFWQPLPNTPQLLSRNDEQAAMRRIATIVDEIEATADWDTSNYNDVEFHIPWNDPLSAHAHMVSALGGRRLKNPLWAVARGAMVDGAPSGFQNLVSEKERDLVRYVADYDEAWLIIDVPWEGWAEVGSDAVAHQYSTQFSRVYFHEGASRKVHRAV
jgi:hypothetical protein